MASYALPTAIPHSHQHGPGHMHSYSHSPPTFAHRSHQPSRRSDRSSLSGHSHSHSFDSEHEHHHDHSHDHSHSHSHDHAHAHAHSHSDHPHEHHHAAQNSTSYSANSAHHLRPNVPPPLDGQKWATTSTSGGKYVITPSKASFFEPAYDAPVQATSHQDHGSAAERSMFTNFLLPRVERWPLLHAILVEKDSRRIFYFMSINFSFMMIQAFYGYATDSLGLLSDSIHMLFDCVALAVGLFASVASKWAPNARFPYGFGKIETLSGFANGVFLILISVEIMFEAFERILDGRETKRLTELFIVSTAGLLVNLIGLMAFGHHHHHGDNHGHCHSHSHDHARHDHGHDHAHSHDGHHGHSHGHDHSHDNENMMGIYLHVLADTLGSAAVIASTVLTHFWKWAGWDPLASFLIAVLILGSAMPLVGSSARRLLLTVPDRVEYGLRDTLSGIMGLRGVANYSVPRFWVDDRSGSDGPAVAGGDRLLGVMHVVAVRGADMEDVGNRVRTYLADKGIDITVQVEREGDTTCWCGVGRSPLALGHKASQSVL